MSFVLPTYKPVALSEWQRRAVEQGEFNWVLPSRLEWFYTSQAADALTISTRSVLNLSEEGKLEVAYRNITGDRKELRISRRSLLLYHASTSQLPPQELAARAVEFIHAIKCPKVLAPIVAAATAQLQRLTDR